MYVYIYMTSLRMQLRSAAKTPLPDSDSDVDGGGTAEDVPWLLQLLLSNDKRITKIAHDVREGVAPTARQYQSSACCKRWQLQLMLIYTYVYGGNMEGQEPKSENQLFHSTETLHLGPKHTLAYTLTDNARAWLAKYDFFIERYDVHGDRRFASQSAVFDRYQKWGQNKENKEVMSVFRGLVDDLSSVTILREIAVYNMYIESEIITFDPDTKFDAFPPIPFEVPAGTADMPGMIMRCMCLFTEGGGQGGGGMGDIDHYFTIIIDKEGNYYLNTSYGSPHVQIDQTTRPIDIEVFYQFCSMLPRYAKLKKKERTVLRALFTDFFLTPTAGGERRAFINPIDECREGCEADHWVGVDPETGEKREQEFILDTRCERKLVTKVGWIYRYQSLLDSTIALDVDGVIEGSKVLNPPPSAAEAAEAAAAEEEEVEEPVGGKKTRRRRIKRRRSKRGKIQMKHHRRRSNRQRRKYGHRTRQRKR
jgi:hypothetical protein